MDLLSPDDVLTRTFATTKFREGYDVEEVDEFLDEVLGTLRALYAENDQLKQDLATAQSAAPAAEPVAVPEPSVVADPETVAELEEVRGRSAELQAQLEAATARAEQAEAALSEAEQARAAAEAAAEAAQEQAAAAQTEFAAAPVAAPAPVASEDPAAAAGIIQLAQKLHDDHVRAGQEEAERLIAEAKQDSGRIIQEAEEYASNTRAALEADRTSLEQQIDGLKEFESTYRKQLGAKLNALLSELNSPVA